MSASGWWLPVPRRVLEVSASAVGQWHSNGLAERSLQLASEKHVPDSHHYYHCCTPYSVPIARVIIAVEALKGSSVRQM